MTRYTEQFSVQQNTKGVSVINTILIVLIVLLVTAAAFFYISAKKHALFEKSFQVVALDTGEVFFGKVKYQKKDIVELSNVYYLPINASDLFSQDFNANSDSLSVIKIGNELHGPEDSMFILQEHIVFIQNLRENSAVVAAIKEYQQ